MTTRHTFEPFPFVLPALFTLLLGLVVFMCAGCIRTLSHTTRVIDHAQDSIVRVTNMIEEGEAVCTGEMIAPKRVLTAAHCIGEGPIYADGVLATVIRKEDYYDLAYLSVDVHRPILLLRDTPVHRFEPLTAVGYAFGLTRLLAISARTILVDYSPDPSLLPGIVVESSYQHGMSGGPVIDEQGRMVGVIQTTNRGIGYGVGVVLIHAFLLGLD